MRVNFSFQGWITGADIKEVVVSDTSETLDVRDVNPETLEENLNNGTWLISLGDFLYKNQRDNEIEIFDFEIDR